MLGKDINIYLPLKLGCLFLIVQFGHKKELGGIHFWKAAYLFTGWRLAQDNYLEHIKPPQSNKRWAAALIQKPRK
jgi:hypothetical protein